VREHGLAQRLSRDALALAFLTIKGMLRSMAVNA